MGIGTILVGLALLAVVVALVMQPLLHCKSPLTKPQSPRAALEAERAVTIRAIREMDFDYRTHKLLEQDYKQLRETLVQRGTQILRAIDALDQQENETRNIDAEIEARVAAYKKVLEVAPTMFCPACGDKVKSTDRFCARCGRLLATDDETSQKNGV